MKTVVIGESSGASREADSVRDWGDATLPDR